MNPAIEALIAAAKSKPLTHASVVTYSDGSEQRIDHRGADVAENHLRSYRPLIGKHEYISRSTGKKITIVSCEVVGIA